MLWRYYDDHRTHTLTGAHPETVAELSRYAAFLDCDLPYQWSEDRFDTIDWIGLADRLTFGLIAPISKRLERRNQKASIEGDAAVWPFVRATDLPMTLVR